MYIARVPNRTSPPAILLRESFREDGKVKSRTLANITSWAPERIEALDRALHGDFDHAALSEPTVGPVFGLLFVLKQVADQIGISAALGSREIGKLGLFLVLSRIAHQGSRLSAVRWAESQAVAEVLGVAGFPATKPVPYGRTGTWDKRRSCATRRRSTMGHARIRFLARV